MAQKLHELYEVIVNTHEESARIWLEKLSEAEKNRLSRVFLSLAARLSFYSARSRRKIFEDAEKFGAHFLPVHFYSPIPARKDIDPLIYERRYDRIPGLLLSREGHLDWLSRLGRYSSELATFPLTADVNEGKFFWRNPAFSPGDSSVYYCLIRELRPRTIIEIGSGYSSLIALAALTANGAGSLVCIEPYPIPALRTIAADPRVTLIESRIQDVDLDLFKRLSENDILFIDSSHISKIGSDVNHEVFEILPILSPGVFCHFHDIFFPWEFERQLVEELKVFWNEQYLVMAFLAYNDRFRIEISNQFMRRELATEFKSHFQDLPSQSASGGASLWIKAVR